MINEPDHWFGVELRHFAALQALASEGSFRQAAERLGYTQSAVSQQIAALERMVGERLVDRPGGPRPIALTEAGRLLLRHAEAILARIHAAQADLATLASGVRGTVNIGTYQSVSRRILPNLMREFSAAWPELEITLNEAVSDYELLPLIESGELDLTFGLYPLPPGPFESIEVLSDPYVLLVPATWPLAHSATFDLDQLAGQPLIGYRQCRSVEQIEVLLRSRGIEPRVVFRSDDNGTVQALVAAGMGVALLPRLALEHGDPGVAVLDFGAELPTRRIALVWHRDRYRSPSALSFVEMACRLCAELGAWPAEVKSIPA